MKTRPTALRSLLAATLMAWAITPGAWAQMPPRAMNQAVTLDFVGADIEAVAQAVGAMIGRNVLVDPRVKGSMNLTADRPVMPNQALHHFQSALRMHGFAMLDMGGMYKVVPEAEAKLQAGRVMASGEVASGGEVVTKVFQLQHESAAQVVSVLRPLISPNNTINANPGNNTLVVTDYADNLQRIGRVIASLDVSNTNDLAILPLQHALASEMAPLLQRLLESGGGSSGGGSVRLGASATAGLDAGPRTMLMAEPRSNALIVRAPNAAKLKQVRALVAMLDQPALQGGDTGNIHVVYLKNADAVTLAATLRAALASLEASTASALEMSGGRSVGAGAGVAASSQPPTQASGGDASQAATSALQQGPKAPSVGGAIQADPNTNSLIISASPPVLRQLRAVIDKLDTRRAQVMVESMIVEVSASKLAEFGVQWQAFLSDKGSPVGALGTNSSNVGGNILTLSAAALTGDYSALGSLGRGMNLALAPKIAGQYYLGMLANFLQTSGDANVLSTPNLMTLDNEEARIVIGNNVPFVTGSYATTGGANTVSPFTTVERKDVGLMLRVRPQINENGTVKLVVSQEVSNIDQASLKNANGPTTSKRSIESTVLVEDGSIVALGGLLQDDYSTSIEKVPVLGDLPGIGNLFKSQNRSRSKTNLMVFLRPVVVRDAAASDALTLSRYDAIRGLQQQVQPEPSAVLGSVNSAPVLPLLQPGAAAQPLPIGQPAASPVDGAVAAPQPLGSLL